MGRTYKSRILGPARVRRSSLRPLCKPVGLMWLPKIRAAAAKTFCARVKAPDIVESNDANRVGALCETWPRRRSIGGYSLAFGGAPLPVP